MPTSDVETIYGQVKSIQINLIGYKMHCELISLQSSCSGIMGQKSTRIRYIWSVPSVLVLRFQHASCNDFMSIDSLKCPFLVHVRVLFRTCKDDGSELQR